MLLTEITHSNQVITKIKEILREVGITPTSNFSFMTDVRHDSTLSPKFKRIMVYNREIVGIVNSGNAANVAAKLRQRLKDEHIPFLYADFTTIPHQNPYGNSYGFLIRLTVEPTNTTTMQVVPRD
ncbi:MAG: hypothetical protein ACXW2E_01990 [Nitrososphaeraceae archaeon]